MIPLIEPDLGDLEAEFVSRCIRDNWVSSAGPDVEKFEAAISTLTGRKFPVATVNGTAALHLSLLAIGIRPGDHIIVPDWTFAATANAVEHARAVPYFIDVREQDWAIDPDLVDHALANNANIRAVIAVDPLGHAADLSTLTTICEKHNVKLIEDAAGAIGATFKNRPCGSFGEVSTFSFNGNKTITTGGGGMLLTDDARIADKARHLSTQARLGRDYLHDGTGYNYRMPNINAALGLAQLQRLDEILTAKQAIAKRYDDAIAGLETITPMPRPKDTKSSHWLYSVKMQSKAAADSLIKTLENNGIQARPFWRSLSQQAPWQHSPKSPTPISQALSGTVVSLPSSSRLPVSALDEVVTCVGAWCNSTSPAVCD